MRARSEATETALVAKISEGDTYAIRTGLEYAWGSPTQKHTVDVARTAERIAEWLSEHVSPETGAQLLAWLEQTS